jgi:predicted AAA+ superfamily ATPase
MLQNTISELLKTQRLPIIGPPEIQRANRASIKLLPSFATILTGIRRCGKSTLQVQLMRDFPGAFYCNFENPGLFGMDERDFPAFLAALDAVAPLPAAVFLDEVQEISGWQRLVRALLDNGRMTCVTGSNASLLGRELGAKLTGRHLSHCLQPFCYSEYLAFTDRARGRDSLLAWLDDGGFPSYLRTRNETLLWELLRDVVQRDVVLRHNLRETSHVMNLALFLYANTGLPCSFQGLAKNLAIPGAAQVSAVVGFLRDAYLLLAVPKFSQSFKQRVVAPAKYYAIDNGLRRACLPQYAPDVGRRLENAVALEVFRLGRAPAYAAEKDAWECDFVTAAAGGAVTVSGGMSGAAAVQVCLELNAGNFARETRGLLAAAAQARTENAFILTLDQRDTALADGRKIEVIPAWEWLG